MTNYNIITIIMNEANYETKKISKTINKIKHRAKDYKQAEIIEDL